MPFVAANDSGVLKMFTTLPFNHGISRVRRNTIELSYLKQELVNLLEKNTERTENCYNLMRRKATEVLV